MDKVTNDLDFGGLTKDERRNILKDQIITLESLLLSAIVDLVALDNMAIKSVAITKVTPCADPAFPANVVETELLSIDGTKDKMYLHDDGRIKEGSVMIPVWLHTGQKAIFPKEDDNAAQG
jgi:hypothetical protein